MLVSLVSLDQVWEDKTANLAQCRRQAEFACRVGAELVVFPEMTLTGFSMNASRLAEDPEESESIRALSRIARELEVNILAGVILRTATLPANCLVHFDAQGHVKARYDKVHPFSYGGEHLHYAAGRQLGLSAIGDWRLGLSICYDLRFPGLYSAMAPASDLLINIANWPVSRVTHWHTLLRARAIENQCYMIGVNRVGVDGNGLHYEKSSQAISPSGDLLEPSSRDEMVDTYDLSLESLGSYREAFPVQADNRPDLYRL